MKHFHIKHLLLISQRAGVSVDSQFHKKCRGGKIPSAFFGKAGQRIGDG